MRARAFLFLIFVATACEPKVPASHDGGGDDDDDAVADARIVDAPAGELDTGASYPDAPIYPDGGACDDWQCPTPVADGCGATELCGNGADDDCDVVVDEGCPCAPGAVQPCFLGPPGKRGVGTCVDGSQTCFGVEFGAWGECRGGIVPDAEACDGQDSDCNGCDDDHPLCCVVELACPGPGDLPDGAPFNDYVIDGTTLYGGPAISWSWEVSGGPCDELLFASSGHTSFDLAGENTSTLVFRPTLSGDYTIHLTIVTAAGLLECKFIVHIAGPGLRIEACWDTTGQSDLDLHLHRPGTTTPWLDNMNNDDCGYFNCKAGSLTGADWGYPASPLSECVGGPDGALWATAGACRNPRLDIDNIVNVGVPENINVDVPEDGATYRVALHYYAGSAVTHPLVNVYCGGYLLGSYGAAPDQVPNFNVAGQLTGAFWRVVDVTPVVVDGVTTGCELAAIHPPGETSGYHVTTNDPTY
jgi:hypothetical protein